MHGENPGTFWRVRYTVLTLLIFGWLFSFLDRMVMSMALPFIGKDFALDSTLQGAVLSAFFAGYALFHIPGGLLADKFGSRKTMTLGIAWWSIFTSVTGLVATLPQMIVTRFVFGLGEACYPGASFKALATYFPARQKGRAVAVMSVINTLGPALASLVGAGIIAYYGWRSVFVILGLPGLFVALAIWRYYHDNPAAHRSMTRTELDELNPAGRAAAGPGTPVDEKKVSYLELLKEPALWRMLLMMFLFGVTFWGFISWLPSYLMKVRGFSLIKTGTAGSLPFFVGTFGSLLGGYLFDRVKFGRRWLYAASALLSGCFLYLTYTVTSADMAVFYQCIAAFFLLFALATISSMIVKFFPPRIMGSATGTINIGSQLAGFVSPLVMGYLIDVGKGSFENAFVFIILTIVGSALVAVTLREQPEA